MLQQMKKILMINLIQMIVTLMMKGSDGDIPAIKEASEILKKDIGQLINE